MTDYTSTSPPGACAAHAPATDSVAPETEEASSPPAAAYAALVSEKKRLVWAALEDSHLDIQEASEILGDLNAEGLLLEEERRRSKRRTSATCAERRWSALKLLPFGRTYGLGCYLRENPGRRPKNRATSQMLRQPMSRGVRRPTGFDPVR